MSASRRFFLPFLAAGLIAMAASAASAALAEEGIVKWFNAEKGIGAIAPTCGGDDIYFEAGDLREQRIAEGRRVAFEVGQGRRGPQARNIQPIAKTSIFCLPKTERLKDESYLEGVVAWYNDENGIGVIKVVDQPDVFFADPRARFPEPHSARASRST